jgi:hypothetical protein
MNLLKRTAKEINDMTANFPDPPSGNKTDIKDVILSIDDLSKIEYEPVYILMAPGRHGIDMVGVKDDDDVAYWANKFQVFKDNEVDPKKRVLLKVKLCDTERLPYSITSSDKLFIFYHGEMFSFNTTEMAARSIEKTIENQGAGIDDFVVTIGIEMSEWLTKRVNKETAEFAEKLEEEANESQGKSASS